MPLDLVFKEYGEVTNEPMVIMHGQLGSSRNWTTLAKALSENFRVITVDLRNHGESPHDPDMSYSSLVGDLLKLVERLKLGPVTLVGHSLGGKTAMAFACRYPMKVRRLVVLDISPKTYEPHFDQVYEGLTAINLNTIHSRQEADQFLQNYIHDANLRQFVLTNLVRDAEGNLHWQMNTEAIIANKYIVTQNPLGASSEYRGPTLFIRGGASEFMTDEDYPIITKHFPRAKIINFEGIGHNVHTEAKEQFLSTLRQFCQES